MSLSFRFSLGAGLTSYSFVSAKEGAQANLSYINAAGNAIMKVDNTTNLDINDKRNAIRISTTDRYTVGSLWIADILHLPYGVGCFANCFPEGRHAYCIGHSARYGLPGGRRLPTGLMVERSVISLFSRIMKAPEITCSYIYQIHSRVSIKLQWDTWLYTLRPYVHL